MTYATKEQLEAWLEAGKGGYELSELEAAWKRVRNPEHWKMDVDAVVPAELAPILEYAVPWFTGGAPPEVEDLGDGTVRVTADGYWSNGMEG